MTTKEAAEQLRREYKACSWNARMISVRTEYASLMSAINVTIKDARIPYQKAKEMAEVYERIARDSRTGEILSGGNRYIDVDDAIR